jgi:hypothetical protein
LHRQYADGRQFRLLRKASERAKRRDAGYERKQVAPSHAITSPLRTIRQASLPRSIRNTTGGAEMRRCGRSANNRFKGGINGQPKREPQLATRFRRSRAWSRRSQKGHEDQFPPSSLSSRFGLGKATFAWTR